MNTECFVFFQPLLSHLPEQIEVQQQLLKEIYKDLNDLNESLVDLQEVREQVEYMIDREQNDEDIKENGEGIMDKVNGVEEELISPKQETFQDVINFRNKLDGQLYQLLQTIDNSVPPLTKGERDLYEELEKEWSKQQQSVKEILTEDVPSFNKLLKEKGVEYIAPKKEEKPKEETKPTT